MRMGRAGGLLVDGTAEEHLRIGPGPFQPLTLTFTLILPDPATIPSSYQVKGALCAEVILKQFLLFNVY